VGYLEPQKKNKRQTKNEIKNKNKNNIFDNFTAKHFILPWIF
jgi:hypothetical protein